MPKKKTYSKERKEFIKRFITVKNGDYSRQMKYTKILFEKFDPDFLSKVRPPHWWKKDADSLYWLASEKGIEWLKYKQGEFFFKVDEEMIVEHSQKYGEDGVFHKKKSLREFLSS